VIELVRCVSDNRDFPGTHERILNKVGRVRGRLSNGGLWCEFKVGEVITNHGLARYQWEGVKK
jgi:hypothetical protein